MERLVVLEVNEVPLRAIDWWIERHPSSAIAALVDRGSITETVLDETLPRDLYPSQSWASFGMGVPYEKHGVFWYGDPKPSEYPFYWQAAAAAGRTVGLLGVLHSSPRLEQAAGDRFSFVVPDVFGDDPTTHPPQLESLQELNLRLSRQSARVARLRLGFGDLPGAASFARNGVRPRTWLQLGSMAVSVARGRSNKERLRVGQSLLLSDVFEKAISDHDPDLSVMFVNHVASFMHRYWAATFPGDWPNGSGYSEEWTAEHAGELDFAMEALDQIVGRLGALAERTGRTLILASSMGQQADNQVDTGGSLQAVIRAPERFLAAAGIAPGHEIRSAMVPQLSVVARNAADADEVRSKLAAFVAPGRLTSMSAPEGEREIVTFTYGPNCSADRVHVGGAWVDPASVGMTVEAVKDHRSGRHSPRGTLISSRRESWPAEIDAFDFAPMMLGRLDLAALPHHRSLATT